jgi:transcriptional regulator with XRE-family HTH domain
MDNKKIFSTNLNRLMAIHNKSRKDIAQVLGLSYFTVSDWVNGKKYPRMDKVELLARYFGVTKSELIEEIDVADNSPKTQSISKSEQLLLELFRKVPENKQEMIIQMIQVALNTKG